MATSQVLDMLQEFTAAGWRATHLIWLDPEWQCSITDGDNIAIGTGLTPEDATYQASLKALHGDYAERFSLREHMDQSEAKPKLDLRSILKLNVPRTVINRRI